MMREFNRNILKKHFIAELLFLVCRTHYDGHRSGFVMDVWRRLIIDSGSFLLYFIETLTASQNESPFPGEEKKI